MSVVRTVLKSLMGDASSRGDVGAVASEVEEGVDGGDRLTTEGAYALEDPGLDEVVRLVRVAVPTATVEAICEYAQMVDVRKRAARKMAERSLIERLPNPKPSTLGQRLGPTPEVLAEEIIFALNHERR